MPIFPLKQNAFYLKMDSLRPIMRIASRELGGLRMFYKTKVPTIVFGYERIWSTVSLNHPYTLR